MAAEELNTADLIKGEAGFVHLWTEPGTPLIEGGSEKDFSGAGKNAGPNQPRKANNPQDTELYPGSVNPPCSSLLFHHLWTQN